MPTNDDGNNADDQTAEAVTLADGYCDCKHLSTSGKINKWQSLVANWLRQTCKQNHQRECR